MDALGGRAGRREEERDGWRLTDLELLPGGQHGSAVAVNDDGTVIGRSDTEDGGISHAVLWQDGRITDLGTLGGWDSTPCGLNRHGVVVGWSETRPGRMGERRPFIWRDGRMVDLSTLGVPQGFVPTAINDDGWVVGFSDTEPARVTHAFVWKAGEATDLGTLVRGVYQRSHAYDVDNEGRIVGEASVDGMNTVPVIWENGQIRRLSDLEGRAAAINSRGEVMGHTSNSPFVWSPDELTVIGFIKGAMSVMAHGIDREGRVLGTADNQSFLWHRGQFEWLPNPTLGHATASAISDDGRFVVGSQASTPDLQTSRPMVWTRL
ncbi:putative HAF family extracellular repeat protein [Kribbella sp. VKM Ac-2527]|uniref:Putative HAF family extracellular repeat protein n=1 Tax=Kribbella caucasensis TaxID=2512215 RepID=A0A4V3C9D1_9ACTN|nr:hypothetical protein [Kribbella sp. VKM Ac-2527]TDO45094.1 putative HAF family extracellular repeat protein [Kribbella sp. VKM Ac-2527]